MNKPLRLVVAGLALLALAASWTAWRFDRDITSARARALKGGVMLVTKCGPIEYQETGVGVPLLAVHGSGGGRDQGMAFAARLASAGIRVIAMSRFGYLRTSMPADASAAAQADAHVCLLDALGINRAAVMGGLGRCAISAADGYTPSRTGERVDPAGAVGLQATRAGRFSAADAGVGRGGDDAADRF